MGLDDRDWYRDEMRKRAGLKPKWQLWKTKQAGRSAADKLARDNPYFVKPTIRGKAPTVLRSAAITLAICAMVFLFLAFISYHL